MRPRSEALARGESSGLAGEGLTASDYSIGVLEVDYQTHRWSVQGPDGSSVSGLASTASAAKADAEAYAEKRAAERREEVETRQRIVKERREMLQGLRLPDRIGSLDVDISSDPRLEQLQRDELASPSGRRVDVLTYKIDRSNSRSPYPVIADGRPQKHSGYIVFVDGEPLPLGDNAPRPSIKQPRGMWRGSRWRRNLHVQAEKELDAFVERESAIQRALDEEFLRREEEDIFRNRPDERMS